MSGTKILTGLCSQCGGPISFPAELIGTVAQCPRCKAQTELFLAPAPEDSSLPRKGKVWAIIAAVILVVGVAGPIVGLKYFEKWAATKKGDPAAAEAAQAARGAAQAGFGLSAITLVTTTDGVAVEAVGTVTNMTDRQRFGVKLEFGLYDASGHRVGAARAYTDKIAPSMSWEFRVSVSGPNAVSARVASIKEGQ